MRNLKKILRCGLIILTSVMVVGVVGCSNQNTSGKSTKRNIVEAWVFPIIPPEELKKLESEFNSTHKDVQVNLTVLDWKDGREKIKTALSTNKGPDVFYIGVGLDQNYIDAKVLASAKSIGFSEKDLEKYSPLIESNMVGDSVYAIPLGYETNMLFYRKDILSKFGYNHPPSTWEELYKIAEAISKGTMKDGKPEVMGLQIVGMDDHLNAINMSWISMFQAAGGKFMKSNKSMLNSSEGEEALNYMRKFYKNNISIPGPSAVNGFTNGTVAMFYFTQPTADQQSWYTSPDMKDKLGIAPMPKGPKSSAGYFGGHSLAVNANSDKKEQAGEFVKWISSPEKVDVFMKSAHHVPPFDLSKLDSEEKRKIDAITNADKATWDVIFQQINNNIDGNAAKLLVQGRKGYTERWDAQKSQIVSALLGETKTKDALNNIDVKVNQALGD